jgi:hypothetical protein
MTTAYVADTGVFVRAGGSDDEKYRRLRRAVQQAGIPFGFHTVSTRNLAADRTTGHIHRASPPRRRPSTTAGSSSPTNSTTPTPPSPE